MIVSQVLHQASNFRCAPVKLLSNNIVWGRNVTHQQEHCRACHGNLAGVGLDASNLASN
jgi:hypothetical protein